jgi:hypothetical protein
MTETVATLAAHLSGVMAFWLHRLSIDAGGVRVDAGATLAHTTFAEGDHDLVLVSDEAEDGLRLAWDRLPHADEFELLVWGAFRR